MEVQQILDMIAAATTQDALGRAWQAMTVWRQAHPTETVNWNGIQNAYNAKYQQVTRVATPQETEELSPADLLRQGAYAGQEEAGAYGDIWSRYLQTQPGYAQASPWGRAAMERPYTSQYFPERFEMAQRTRPAAEGPQTFEEWLGGPKPTAGQMGTQLGQIHDILAKPTTEYTPEEEKVMGYYGDLESGQARQFWASIQPYLMSMAPSLRSSFAEAAAKTFGRRTAIAPEQQWIAKAKQLGYF